MKRLLLVSLFLIISFALTFTASAEFTVDLDEDGCQLFDFSIGQGDWVIANTIDGDIGSYTGGAFSATTIGSTYPKSKRVLITLDITPTVINTVTVVFDYTLGTWTNSSNWAMAMNTTGGSENINYGSPVHTKSNITNGTNKTKVVTYPGDIKEFIKLDMRSSAVNSGSTSGTVNIKSVEICGAVATDPIVRPLEAEQEDGWGLYEHPGDPAHVVVAASIAPGAFVYSAVAGTVTDVSSLSESTCDSILDVTILKCAIRVPASINGSSSEYVYTFAEGTVGFSTQIYEFSVTIEDSLGVSYTYFVEDADDYVTEGASIQAGCILGKTMNITGFGVSFDGSIIPNKPEGKQGITIVYVDEGDEEILPNMQIYPTSQTACNINPEYSDCLGDSALQHSEDWISQGAVTWLEPGVQLNPQATIRAVYNLDPDREPQMKVSARRLSGNPSLGLRLGMTTANYEVTSSEFQEYVIEGAAHEPSSGVFFDVVMTNTALMGSIEIQYACISFTYDEEGNPEPPPQPPSCYFENNSFNEGTSGWTVSNPGTGVYTYDTNPGEILVQDGQTFQQDVALYPVDGSTPQDYAVRVEVSLYHIPSYTISPSNTTSTIEIEYDYDGAGYVSMGTATYADFANHDNVILFQDTLNISADSDGTFIFRVQTVSQPSEVEAVAIRFACLDTDGGGDFPGYGGDGDPEPPPFNEDCQIIERPSGSAVHIWIAWHWANLNQFFQCDLMVFLNTQYRTFQNFFKTISWAVRYWIVALNMGVDWLDNQFLPWLGGYLSNASGAAVIYYGDGIGDDPDEGCEWWNLVCHAGSIINGVGGFLSDIFDSLQDMLSFLFNDLLVPVVNALFDLIRELVDNILRPLLEALIDLVRRIVDFIFNTLVDFIKKAVSFIFSVLKGIVERVIQAAQFVIGKLVELLLTVKLLVEAIINVWNEAEPATLPGAPNCGVSTNNVMCWVYFVMENTFFSGTIGGLIIPIFTSLAWILLGLSTLGQLLKLVRNAGQAI